MFVMEIGGVITDALLFKGGWTSSFTRRSRSACGSPCVREISDFPAAIAFC